MCECDDITLSEVKVKCQSIRESDHQSVESVRVSVRVRGFSPSTSESMSVSECEPAVETSQNGHRDLTSAREPLLYKPTTSLSQAYARGTQSLARPLSSVMPHTVTQPTGYPLQLEVLVAVSNRVPSAVNWIWEKPVPKSPG